MPKPLSDYDVPSLAAALQRHGGSGANAVRLLRHYSQNCGTIDRGDLGMGRPLEALLRDEACELGSRVATRRESADGAVKILVEYPDAAAVEAVMMPAFRGDRAAGCVSCQVGCAMGCDFCASTRQGVERNLTAGEIFEQFLHLRGEARRASRRLNTIVFMGMGEPMQNLDAVMEAIRKIGDPATDGIGWRQITVSTVGLVPGIETLAASGLNVHLAISLHAPDDETRRRLVPMTRKYGVAEIVSAAARYQEATGRISIVEYCMLAGINDSLEHAERLAELLAPHRMHVNLIPYNPAGEGISGIAYQRPDAKQVVAFLNVLRDRKIVAHLRRPRGEDASAACGQLRRAAQTRGE